MSLNSRGFLCLVLMSGSSFLLTCCATPVARQVPFREAEFARYLRPGSGVVTGRLVVTDLAKYPHVGIDSWVTLLPVGAYTREIAERELAGGEWLARADPRFEKYRRLVECNTDGDFRFTGVPAGEYYLTGMVSWSDVPEIQNWQWAFEKIRVAPGQTVNVALTRNPQRPGKPTLADTVQDL